MCHSRTTHLICVAIAACLRAHGATITVTSAADDGPETLRSAITAANLNGERDTIVFSPAVVGPINAVTPLPALTEGKTTIIGDIDGDGRPDVTIDGIGCGGTQPNGLYVRSDGNLIRQLRIRRFAGSQIRMESASSNTVIGCWINTDDSGIWPLMAGMGVSVVGGGRNRIGVPGRRPNVVLGIAHCVRIADSSHNTIAANRIGADRTGRRNRVDAKGTSGVSLVSVGAHCSHNAIGGPDPRHRNIITGTGVLISGPLARRNRVSGNYVGVTKDGVTPGGYAFVTIDDGAQRNIVGGDRSTHANTIHAGVLISGPGTDANQISGNYIGLHSNGTGSWPERSRGIRVDQGAGRQTIGGDTPAKGNYVSAGAFLRAITFYEGGAGSVVRNNVIGATVNGDPAGNPGTGIFVYRAYVWIRQNVISDVDGWGIYTFGCLPLITENVFRRNRIAVTVGSLGRPRLGDQGNPNPRDDGGNEFLPSNGWYIYSYNYDGRKIMAEGNYFGTADPAAIKAKIWDGRREPGLGIVDFRPYRRPTASFFDQSLASLTVSAALARSSAQTEELTFSLSASADVTCTIRNIAGRTVRTLKPGGALPAGRNTLLWDRRNDRHVPVPAGPYLAEIVARSESGETARALTMAHVRR